MQHSEIQIFAAGKKLKVQQNFQVEASDVPIAVRSFVNPGLLLQELIYSSTDTSSKWVLGLLLGYTKRKLILRITEVLRSATALFIESTFHTMGISTALVEKQKMPNPVLFT